MLPDTLKSRLEKEAERERVSFGELVRQALQKYLLWRGGQSGLDPFLSSKTVFRDQGPADVAARHDDYLTRKNPHGDASE